jgi:hypothetical protein
LLAAARRALGLQTGTNGYTCLIGPDGTPLFADENGLGWWNAVLDENCGADGWAVTPSGTRGVLNDAVSIYFPDAALAGAFVARWCIGYKVETPKGRSGCARTSRHRGLALGCTGRREARETRYPGSLRGLGRSTPRRIYGRRRL